MKKIFFVLLCIAVYATTAFADIPGPNKKPRPTPYFEAVNGRVQPTPAPSAAPRLVPADEAQMAVSLSNWSEGATLVFTRAMVDKINAAAQNKGGERAGGTASTQTIVGGIFLSLAFVFGGMWLARSKGQVSRPALGVLLLAIVGMGTTLVIGNVPPPKRIALSSAIINESVMRNFVAAGKVKIMIVDYENKDDVTLIIPKQPAGSGDAEE